MKRSTIATAALLAALWAPAAGARADSPLHSAGLAWERGDYISALTTYLRVLDDR